MRHFSSKQSLFKYLFDQSGLSLHHHHHHQHAQHYHLPRFTLSTDAGSSVSISLSSAMPTVTSGPSSSHHQLFQEYLQRRHQQQQQRQQHLQGALANFNRDFTSNDYEVGIAVVAFLSQASIVTDAY
jgi:hypothetical protein